MGLALFAYATHKCTPTWMMDITSSEGCSLEARRDGSASGASMVAAFYCLPRPPGGWWLGTWCGGFRVGSDVFFF